MGIFDDVSSTFSRGVSAAGRSATVARLNAQLNQLLRQREGLAAQLGASLYEETRNMPELVAGREQLYEAIAQVDAQRVGIQQQIDQVRAEQAAANTAAQTVRCPRCGTYIPLTDMFCRGCGLPMEQVKAAYAQPAPAPTYGGGGSTCPTCGAPVNPGDAFCMSCGSRLESVAAPVQTAAPAAPYAPIAPSEYSPIPPVGSAPMPAAAQPAPVVPQGWPEASAPTASMPEASVASQAIPEAPAPQAPVYEAAPATQEIPVTPVVPIPVPLPVEEEAPVAAETPSFSQEMPEEAAYDEVASEVDAGAADVEPEAVTPVPQEDEAPWWQDDSQVEEAPEVSPEDEVVIEEALEEEIEEVEPSISQDPTPMPPFAWDEIPEQVAEEAPEAWDEAEVAESALEPEPEPQVLEETVASPVIDDLLLTDVDKAPEPSYTPIEEQPLSFDAPLSFDSVFAFEDQPVQPEPQVDPVPVEEVPEPTPKPSALICPSCGQQYHLGDKFCMYCGTRLT